MIGKLFSLYSPRYPEAIVYMLQSTEYHAAPYLAWYWQTSDFARVATRRTLAHTKAARLMLLALRTGMLLQLLAGAGLLVLGVTKHLEAGWQFGLALILSYPIVWAHVALLPLVLGRMLLVAPKHRRAIRESETVFEGHPGAIIAIAGSYGKTSMKELLATVLGRGKKVAATPANKNVAISHAYFARTLGSDEDIVIIEYGEGEPGDVPRFAKVTHPTHAIITGIAPAHLDRYKTLDRAAQDIFAVADYVEAAHVYVNQESSLAVPYTEGHKYQLYDAHGALGWRVSNVHVGLDGTKFTLKKGSRSIALHSGLLGRHQIGPLSVAAALGAEFGMTDEQIKDGIAKTMPYEHRMQSYNLGGAWVIDDTYNGNLEGIRAGTALLKELPATRKLYVTPGLVDQGKESDRIHQEVGRLIAAANPDVVVLMQNSATAAIRAGLEEAGFAKVIRVEKDPLNFYTNLQSFVAAGDLVMMQNDWTDNYA